MSEYKRGDIVYVDLSGTKGSEQKGVRPSVIVSNDKGNGEGPTLVVIPLTTQRKSNLPTHVRVRSAEGLSGESTLLCEQIRVVSKERVGKSIGKIPSEMMRQVDKRIKIALSLR